MNENVFQASTTLQKRHMSGKPVSTTLDFQRTHSSDAINTGCRGFVRSNDWMNSAVNKEHVGSHMMGEQLMVLNFELDIPPAMSYLPHNVPVHTVDRSTMAEAQFIAQQRKYWPAGLL